MSEIPTVRTRRQDPVWRLYREAASRSLTLSALAGHWACSFHSGVPSARGVRRDEYDRDLAAGGA